MEFGNLVGWIVIAVFLLWVFKNIPYKSYTKEDMEKFWGVKFGGSSLVDPRKVGKPNDSFLRRLKRRLLS
jgi:hypothetical protein